MKRLLPLMEKSPSWLPKNSSCPLDAAPKPYYRRGRYSHVRRRLARRPCLACTGAICPRICQAAHTKAAGSFFPQYPAHRAGYSGEHKYRVNRVRSVCPLDGAVLTTWKAHNPCKQAHEKGPFDAFRAFRALFWATCACGIRGR